VPLERAISEADGIDYVESQSTQGLSTINVRLRLNFNSAAALADISTRVDQVRADLPPEAEIPAISIQPSDAQIAAMYLSFSSNAMAHNQDIRNYGNLRKYLKITTWTMVVGWLAIAGVGLPISMHEGIGLAGFHSKEAILGGALLNEHAQVQGIALGYYAGWLGLFVALLTAMYMTRMSYLTFFGTEERWRSIEPAGHGHDAHAGHHAESHEAHAEHGHEDTFG
jgi:hypothetical protein